MTDETVYVTRSGRRSKPTRKSAQYAKSTAHRRQCREAAAQRAREAADLRRMLAEEAATEPVSEASDAPPPLEFSDTPSTGLINVEAKPTAELKLPFPDFYAELRRADAAIGGPPLFPGLRTLAPAHWVAIQDKN